MISDFKYWNKKQLEIDTTEINYESLSVVAKKSGKV